MSASPQVVGRPPGRDLVLLAVAVAAVSTSAPLVRGAEAPTLAIALWRNALALPVVAGYALVRHRGEARDLGRRERRLASWAGVALAAHFATWVPSLSFTTVASSVALVSTQPVWAALLARARGEAVPARAWLGIALAVAGAALLAGVDLSISRRALFGDALALAGGVLAAVYFSAGAEVRRTVSTALYTSICYATAAVVLLAICIGSGQALTGYDGETWLALAAITVGPQLLGHTVANRVLRTTSATVVSVAVVLEVAGATLLARIFFDETPPAGAWPAAALIATGVVLVVRSSAQPAVSGPPISE
jgi:drug/metabolite transporter (DMT)-like permease